MTPGFHAFLRRQYPEEFKEPESTKTLTAGEVGFEEGNKAGDFAVFEPKNSTSIRLLRYNNKTKILYTTFTSGAIYPYKDVEPEEFLAVINPSEQYRYSVGRAHHAIITKRKKETTNEEMGNNIQGSGR